MTAPLADLHLAVIGNCQVAALIDARAAIVWCCLPRPDGDPVFSALLHADGGRAANGIFAIELTALRSSTQRYVHNTAIVETELTDEHGGVVRITDFCPRFRSRGRMFRPMSLVRIVTPVHGRPVVTCRLRPTVNYGKPAGAGVCGAHHLRFSAADINYRITTDASLSAVSEERAVVLDRPLHFLLGPDETVEENLSALVAGFLDSTRDYWQDWVRTLAIPFDYQAAVIRAAITLKLCTFEDTGAVLAALTTSIPEAPGTTRNWDYRYCWLRDSYFVIQALNRLGATRTMEAYLRYIDNIVVRSSVGDLQPLYCISGDPDVKERVVASLQGYRGMGPVRVGNDAATQNQHDVYGSVILASTQAFFDERLIRGGDALLFERLERLGERACTIYELPDAGPWELRGTRQPHTFSAAMSWAGCDRLARIAAQLAGVDVARRWRRIADGMRHRILARSWNEGRQLLASTFGGEQLDATALLLPELGLIRPDDPRFVSTVDAVGRELTHGALLFRYRHADDFGEPQTAFAICGFWYASALAAIGRVAEARERFQELLRHRTALGLMSEDIALDGGELWGNFPQTYSMVGIVNTALRLSRRWEDML